MKPSTSLFLVAALIIVSPVDHLAADDQVILWTPTELVAKGGDKLWDNVTEFVVQFRVASVRSVPTIFPDGDKRQVPHLVPAAEDNFTVPISQEVESALRRTGITNLEEYFTGKTVRVRGVVSQTGLDLIGSETIWTFHISLRSLDQLIQVSSNQKPTVKPRGAGDAGERARRVCGRLARRAGPRSFGGSGEFLGHLRCRQQRENALIPCRTSRARRA